MEAASASLTFRVASQNLAGSIPKDRADGSQRRHDSGNGESSKHSNLLVATLAAQGIRGQSHTNEIPAGSERRPACSTWRANMERS